MLHCLRAGPSFFDVEAPWGELKLTTARAVREHTERSRTARPRLAASGDPVDAVGPILPPLFTPVP
jgi:hypothetical protein